MTTTIFFTLRVYGSTVLLRTTSFIFPPCVIGPETAPSYSTVWLLCAKPTITFDSHKATYMLS